jgi:hypothetical protein
MKEALLDASLRYRTQCRARQLQTSLRRSSGQVCCARQTQALAVSLDKSLLERDVVRNGPSTYRKILADKDAEQVR